MSRPDPSAPLAAQRRQTLQQSENCRFVDPAEFLSLVVSSRRLFRQDVHHCGLRGLVDEDTGERFYIEDEKLSQV